MTSYAQLRAELEAVFAKRPLLVIPFQRLFKLVPGKPEWIQNSDGTYTKWIVVHTPADGEVLHELCTVCSEEACAYSDALSARMAKFLTDGESPQVPGRVET